MRESEGVEEIEGGGGGGGGERERRGDEGMSVGGGSRWMRDEQRDGG